MFFSNKRRTSHKPLQILKQSVKLDELLYIDLLPLILVYVRYLTKCYKSEYLTDVPYTILQTIQECHFQNFLVIGIDLKGTVTSYLS